MKGLRTTTPGKLALLDLPRPRPKADEALVRMVRAGLCHTDVIIRDGKALWAHYPVIPGHEVAGIVEECGPDAKYVKPGDRVAVHTTLSCGQCPGCRSGDSMACENVVHMGSQCDGGFAEFCAVPARHLYKVPDHVSLEEAALFEPLANAIEAVKQAGVKRGERVVIFGPGTIGLMAVQVARLLHPSLLVLAGTRENRLSRGKQFGATHTVNVKNEGGLAALKDALGGRKADVVIDCAGTRSALEMAMQVIGWRGRIAVEGSMDELETILMAPRGFLQKNAATVIGINGWITSDFHEALNLVAAGLVDVKPMITHTFPLEEWEVAFDMATARKGEAIKVEFSG